MPIFDLDKIHVQGALLCDLCIIGSGAAGISIAREFIGSRHSLILLESGGVHKEADVEALSLSEVTGRPHAGIHKGRARQLGGTTTLWAGQALPLLDIDFECRGWVESSGWPFGRDSLATYYPRAESVMQLDHVDYGPGSWPKQAIPSYDERIASHFSQFTHVPNFVKKYGRDLDEAPNIRVLCHANVVSLEATHEANAIREARIRSLRGVETTVRSRFFVLCAGGIETARLLLASDSVERHGVGNRYDVVGQFFQDHPVFGVPIGQPNARLIQLWCNSFRKKKTRYGIKLVVSPRTQRLERMLNVGAEVYHPVQEDAFAAGSKEANCGNSDRAIFSRGVALVGARRFRSGEAGSGSMAALYPEPSAIDWSHHTVYRILLGAAAQPPKSNNAGSRDRCLGSPSFQPPLADHAVRSQQCRKVRSHRP